MNGYKYQVVFSSQYKRDLKKIQKRGHNSELLYEVIRSLADDIPLEAKYRDHQLFGNMRGFRECHIAPDWLLVYKKTEATLVLYLYSTGTHSDIFG